MAAISLEDQTFLGLGPDQMSFGEENFIESQWGPQSPNSSFDSSTPSGYLTPDSTIPDADSRRQSIISCVSNVRTASFPVSQYTKTTPLPMDLLPVTPRTSFATSLIDWSFSDTQQGARAAINVGAGAHPLTPISSHSPQYGQIALLQGDTNDYLTSWCANEDRTSGDQSSCGSNNTDPFGKTLHYQGDMVAFNKAFCQSSDEEKSEAMPLTGTPSDIFNLSTVGPAASNQGHLRSPASIYATSPTTDDDSFDSECPTAYSSQRNDSHDASVERFGGPLPSTDLVIEVVDTTSQSSQARLSKRSGNRRPRMRRSQTTSRRFPQTTSSSESQTGKSRRCHTCDYPGCERQYEGFERIEHLTRHKQSVHGGSTNTCVFGGVCKDKKFSGRKDNLNAHYTKTHFFIDHPETKGRRRRWVGRDEQEAMGLKDVTRECETLRGKELLCQKGLIDRLPDGSFTEYHEKRI